MLKLTGLWLNVNADPSKTHFGGNLGTAKILIFKNKFKKEGSKEPDYNMYLVENIKKEEGEKAESEFLVGSGFDD